MDAGIARYLQHSEKSCRCPHIASDLFTQQLRRIEPSLIANAPQEL
jgi:hypothetical protein